MGVVFDEVVGEMAPEREPASGEPAAEHGPAGARERPDPHELPRAIARLCQRASRLRAD